MLFDDLPIDHRIKKTLEIMQLTEPTMIQQKSIPAGILGKDILASSKTGSGKTLAFLIPAVNRLLTQKPLSRQDPRAIILAPTRELAKQVFMQAKKLTQKLPTSVALVVGGENYNDQAKILRKNPDIIVGTAGRIADHIGDKHFFLDGIELLILDEADRMLELGFSQQLHLINDKAKHRKRQTMMFSATIDSAAIHNMTQQMLNAPEKIIIDEQSNPHIDIKQTFYLSDGVSHKDQLLLKALSIKDREQAIVFTATREDTSRIAKQLEDAEFIAAVLHGELAQNQRSAVINSFTSGKQDVLVTTDLAARGLDLLNVALVINYDMPKFADEYIHRIGRTGRAGNQGEAKSFISRKDWGSFQAVKTKLNQQYDFSEIEGISTKFTGVKSKKEIRSKNEVSKSKGINKKANTSANSSVKKSSKRLLTEGSVDAGFIPVKRKIRPIEDSASLDTVEPKENFKNTDLED